MSKIKLSDLVVVTTNQGKLKEINKILGINHQVSKINVPEIQSLNLDEVISSKAKAAYEILKKPVLVTDVSLEIEALGGLPGPLVKYFISSLGVQKTVNLLNGKSTKAKVTDAVAIYDGKTLKIFKGTIHGHLARKSRGAGRYAFGFDVLFIPAGSQKTFAEMSTAEKNKISHRAKALKKLKKYLEPVI